MTKLEENIKHYMELKGIRFYSDLLVDIAHQLGIRGNDAYKFAEREKANFSKMLKGERPLKYDFIIPLETIFGVSLAKLLNKDAFKLPIYKENVRFDKGFRYYAYVDEPELYEKELATILDKDGENILCNYDEFRKTFLDYVVEYNSVNGIKFLHDKYNLKLRYYNNQFDTEPKGMFWLNSDKGIPLARMISNMNDIELFNDIYDPRYMMASNGYYLKESIFVSDDFATIVLENENLFNSMFESKPYKYVYSRKGQIKHNKECLDFISINPTINTCLNFALKHLNKYKKQANEILNFGINHNQRIIDGLTDSIDCIYMDECGGLMNYKNNYEIFQVAVFVSVEEINDAEIIDLIEKLPTFKKL